MSAEPHDDHGHSPAAWTLVVIVMLGFLIGSIAMVAASPVWFWIGVAVIVLGCIIGKVMQMMNASPDPMASTEDRVDVPPAS